MVDVSVMVEGPDDLSWERWQRIGFACEELGFDGLYRSDHFPVTNGSGWEALELWISLTWLASKTRRIRFGALVSPISFRDPVTLAWQASAVDALSGGRLDLGLGAGWMQREHTAFGYDLLDTPSRFNRFREGIKVVRLLTRSETPVSFEGDYFRLHDAMLMPRSPRKDGPPITIGGAGKRRTMPLVAKYADEWNSVPLKLDDYIETSDVLDKLLDLEGRPTSAVRRTMMASVYIGTTEADIARRLGEKTKQEIRSGGQFVGTPSDIVEQLGPYIDAGIDGFKLRLPNLDDMETLDLIAREVMPHIRGQRS
ncbi:MAG: TIGR03560 family F420-dependent LLM class oxidoreductase [Thermomicrobiales bacterium]